MGIPSRLMRNAFGAVFASLVVLSVNSTSVACDTPVYRYAMYRWFPAPYEVYYFYEGEMGEAGQQMKDALDKAGESEEAPTNIVFLGVDLLKDKELTGVPPDVKEAWNKQEEKIVPSFLVSSPVGAHLLKGSLTIKDLPAMIDSPIRQQTGKLLEAGNAGVYIFLKGENAESSAAAEKVLRGVVDDVKAGKVELYTLPPALGRYPNEEGEEEGEEDNPYKLSVGLVTLSRTDAAEKWLVDCLLALEPDLRESKEPIVFMVYGRGRVLFSCLGKGIHRDNLIQDIEFVTGACSCTVKEQNPGVDLLMRYNWDAAAEAISMQYGTEEGSRYEFGGDALFPELIIPPEGEMGDEATGDVEEPSGSDAIAAADTGTSPDVDPEVAQDPEASATGEGEAQADSVAENESETKDSRQELAALTPSRPTESGDEADSASNSSMRGIAWVGAGLLGALIVLFGATFLVLRPK